MAVTTSYTIASLLDDSVIGTVNSGTAGDVGPFDFVVSGNGTGYLTYAFGGDIVFDTLARNGTTSVSNITLNTTTAGDQHDPAADSFSAGGFFAAWIDEGPAAGNDIRVRIFNDDGTARSHDANGSPGTDDFSVAFAGEDFTYSLMDATAIQGNFVVGMVYDNGISTALSIRTFDATSGIEVTPQNPGTPNTITGFNNISEFTFADGANYVGYISNIGGNDWVQVGRFSPTSSYGPSFANADNTGTNADVTLATGGNTVLAAYTADVGATQTVNIVQFDSSLNVLKSDTGSAAGAVAGQPYLIQAVPGEAIWVLAYTKEISGTDTAVVARLVDARGANFVYSSEITLDADTGLESGALIRMFETGEFVVAYQDDDDDGDGTSVNAEVLRVSRTSDGDSSGELIEGDNFNDIINGNGGNDNLFGSGGNDEVYGGAGYDTIYAGPAGSQTLDGPDDGNDFYSGGGEVDTLSYYLTTLGVTVDLVNLVATGAEIGTDTLADDFENIDGGEGNDTLLGNDRNNIIDGRQGVDNMAGGLGDDTYIVDSEGETVTEFGGEGYDFISVSGGTFDYVMPSAVEELNYVGSADVNITGNEIANVISATSGNNIIDGGAGADEMYGHGGDDTYVVDDPGDMVWENGSAGTDTVRTYISHVMANNVENAVMLGTGDLGVTGNSLDNVITGNSGNNTLDGGSLGTDMLLGGDGNDTYIIRSATQSITENADEGTDQVNATVGFVLPAHVENLSLLSTTLGDAIGNDLDNVLIGSAASNTLDGLTGADTMLGGDGNDIYVVDNVGDVVSDNAGLNGGTDQVNSSVSFVLFSYLENLSLLGTADINAIGNELDNNIFGNAGNNTLDGLTGADDMRGGDGDDIYVVDNAGDQVSDNAGPSGGIDQVNSYVGFTLFSYLENLSLLGTSDIDAVGNELDNILLGNAGNNTLDGLGGADDMQGGAGDDIYVVDNVGDTVSEAENAGTDQVNSSVGFSLFANLENLSLLGSGNINGVGNTLDNVIIGNSGNNTLDGLAGADTMVGQGGNDIYVVDDTGDIVSESPGGGTDQVNASVSFTLFANIEHLSLLGSANIDATGNELDNNLFGNSGDNVIIGNAGNDLLVGNGGNDTYVFGDGAGNDTITDFSAGAGAGDVIDIAAFGFADFAAVLAAADDSAGTGPTVIQLDGDDSITLQGVLEADLAADDFLLV